MAKGKKKPPGNTHSSSADWYPPELLPRESQPYRWKGDGQFQNGLRRAYLKRADTCAIAARCRIIKRLRTLGLAVAKSEGYKDMEDEWASRQAEGRPTVKPLHKITDTFLQQACRVLNPLLHAELRQNMEADVFFNFSIRALMKWPGLQHWTPRWVEVARYENEAKRFRPISIRLKPILGNESADDFPHDESEYRFELMFFTASQCRDIAAADSQFFKYLAPIGKASDQQPMLQSFDMCSYMYEQFARGEDESALQTAARMAKALKDNVETAAPPEHIDANLYSDWSPLWVVRYDRNSDDSQETYHDKHWTVAADRDRQAGNHHFGWETFANDAGRHSILDRQPQASYTPKSDDAPQSIDSLIRQDGHGRYVFIDSSRFVYPQPPS